MKSLRPFFCFLCLIIFQTTEGQSGEQVFLQFLEKNRENAALYIVKNDTVVASLHPNNPMPLASTVKIMVAIEFAKQAGAGVFDAEQPVALKEIEKYYIPFTDGNAHPTWLKYLKQQNRIVNDSVRLIDVAKGMIRFSSNANTDYLIELLGVQNINSNIKLLNLSYHTPIYPLVGALFLYQNPKNKKEEQILKSISKLDDNKYASYAYSMHKALSNSDKLKSSFRPVDLTMNMQRMWSDRLPASTVRTYAQIARTLNRRAYFSKEAYDIIAQVMEFVMENPNNQSFLKHAGMKGGSTSFVLTKCMYAYTTEGDYYEVVVFFNNIPFNKVMEMSKHLNDFELSILSEPEFLQQVKEKFKP
jgi:D-alanyl-D-alanine carboxypeptidase